MKWIFKIIGGILLVSLAILLFGYVTMYLWNMIMPYLFHLPTISFKMAIGILILSKIIFGGFRMRGGPGGYWRQRKFWKAKWESMTPDERDKFKNDFAFRCRQKWGGAEVNINVEKGE